jgi:hypothetical protein
LVAGTSGQTLRHDGTTWVANSNLYNNGTQIGIGTTAPISPLDISYSTVSAWTSLNSKNTLGENYLDIDAATNYGSGIRMLNNGTCKWLARNSPTNSDFEIWEYNNGARLTVQKLTGNVGIGTATPTSKLEAFTTGAGNDVKSRTDATTNSASFSAINDVNNYFKLEKNGSASSFTVYGIPGADLARFTTNTSGMLIDAATNLYFGTGAAERMRIDATGNVGINNVLPTSKLDVNYNASIYTQQGTALGALKAVNGSNYTWLAYGSYAAIFNGNVIPNNTNTYDLGNTSWGFRDLYLTDKLFVNGAATANSVLTTNGTGVLQYQASNALPGTIAGVASNSASCLQPTLANTYTWTGPTVSFVITSTTQKVIWTSTLTMGAGATAATGLNIEPCYGTAIANNPSWVGGGTYGLTCPASNRSSYTVTATITGLAPGTYYFGAAVSVPTIGVWTNNEWGYISAQVIN